MNTIADAGPVVCGSSAASHCGEVEETGPGGQKPKKVEAQNECQTDNGDGGCRLDVVYILMLYMGWYELKS